MLGLRASDELTPAIIFGVAGIDITSSEFPDPSQVKTIIKKQLCSVLGCAQCLSGDNLCEICSQGFVLTRDRSECVDCGLDSSPKAENICHGFTKGFTFKEVEKTGLGVARTSGYEDSIDLSKSGSVFQIEIKDFEKWSWRLASDGSKFSEFDGGLMRHNIFRAFRFDIDGV